MTSDLNLVSCNVNGLKLSKKRIKMFEYLNNKIYNDVIVILQETHSSENTESEWKNDFKGKLYFSHGTTSSRGVMIGFKTTKKFSVGKISKDDNGRILIIEALINDTSFVLVNLYNANTEPEQLKTLCKLDQLLDDFSINNSQNIILAGDFNFFFDLKLEASGGTPTLKKQSISNFIQLTGKCDLVDIWRIRNPLSNRFTYRKNHFSGLIQRRLDYILFRTVYKSRFKILMFYLHFVAIIHQSCFLTKMNLVWNLEKTYGNLTTVLRKMKLMLLK